MKNLRQRIDKWVGTFLIIILSIMIVNVLWQVFTRFFTTSPSSFTEELARYLMIWLGILGGAYVAGKNEHVAITVFTKKLKPKIQQQIQLFVRLTIVTFAFVGMVIGGCRLVFITFILNQYSPALGIPLAAVYAVIPVSGLLIMFYKLFPTNA